MILLAANGLPRQGLNLKPLTLVTGADCAERVDLIRKALLSLKGPLQSPVVRARLTENGTTYQAPVPSGAAPYLRCILSLRPSNGDSLRAASWFQSWSKSLDSHSIFETLTGTQVRDVVDPSDGDAFNLRLARCVADAMVDAIPSIVLLPDVVSGKLHGSYSAHKRLATVLCGVASPHVVLVVGANPDTHAAVKEAIARGDLDPEDYVEWNEEK